MDANVMYNNVIGGYPQYAGYNPGFYYQPQAYPQNMRVPQNQNALTPEEIQRLRNSNPNNNALNLSIEQDEMLRAICTHKDNGRDMVQLVQDGSGDVYCPICGERWNPATMSKDEVKAAIDTIIAQMQNAKWTGEYPQNVAREYFAMIPLLKKFPDLFEYGAKNFEKYLNQRGFYNAADANIYAQYNSMFGPGMGYGQPMYQGMGMYGQQPMGQPQGYYQQQPTPAAPAMPADPNTNPMQAPYGAPYYNPQFGNQANIMMQGTYYQQPYQPPMAPQPAMPQQGQQPPYNPVYGTAPQGQPQQNAQQAPAHQAQPQQTQTTTTKVDL